MADHISGENTQEKIHREKNTLSSFVYITYVFIYLTGAVHVDYTTVNMPELAREANFP